MVFVLTAAESLRRSVFQSPWHGPSLLELIADITADEAAACLDHTHSVLELTLHLAVWVEETASRLEGKAPAVPAAGDWPPPLRETQEAWRQAQEWLARAGTALTAAAASFPESRLDEVVGARPGSPAGSDITFGTMLIGIAEYNAYHAGQIAILKRLLRSRRNVVNGTSSA